MYRSAAATACTATVETSSKATSSSVFTPTAHAETHINNINNSIPLAMASPIPSVSQNDAPLAPSTACEMKEVKEMKEMKETKESSPVGASSPESPVHPSTKGTSPLSPDEPLAGGVLHTGIDKGDSMLEWDMGLSPRNSMVMRRRSVDMGYLMSSGKLSADHHPSRDAEEDHTHTHAHEHEHIHTMLPAITPEVDEESDGEDIVNSIEQSLEVFST